MKVRSQVRIGWLTPLLGLFVLVDLTSFWSAAWQSRELIPASYGMMLLGLLVTGLYYFSASMVFPDKPEDWPDFDDWAARHKRQVLGGIFTCNVIATIALLLPRPEAWGPTLFGTHGVLLTMMGIAAFARARWLSGVMLVAMIIFYLWLAWVATGR